ncbi:protein-disulfide reductase DsbD [Photorhabdus laumondii subsp. laumondii]|uniref:Thiol:disulfide interchange protein DsbD n=2 Tax=Photorhabdus laumondii subsp. laumondii TaxID=141679 RepID=DSBD_PHOLL|nr:MULTISPECIES: protein-disulfide reductase DsbD [Photorhabdus]Q7MZX2.1 RecName: Full=Thiol:disulfide interchange protein DsbD; AltName: Full=Protein-disulfide reductase; Short=Disulfide reductase; Flags: Precursor [Photorhabdus laumondii subsp. laumondii TTO1]AWK43716.1 protein-disulfide reductase DsbD [Photorhabdus laumondii subsp. laumondii]AXG44394.1 thiol:disulfide interchange protein DsbD [Photorhabdus laumondii subsp. laumondii]AXG49025.1 thiol:disulfide interchange protein DsbD [Photor
MIKRTLMLFLLLCSPLLTPAAANALFEQPGQNPYLPVDQAFMFDFQQKGDKLTLDWQIKPGYYLYHKQLHIEPQQATLGKITLPQGTAHRDEFFGETEVYFQQLIVNVPVTKANNNSNIVVTYQGCAAAGYCYPPETRLVPLSAVIPSKTTDAISAEPVHKTPESASNDQQHLPFSPLWAILIGIGIAFTPCVLPMYPLISSIILGSQRPKSLKQIFWLALSYVQGMAVTYTLLGLIVAAAGLQFQAALQHPYVLIGLSVLFILLALSMFGLYSLQLPSAVQTRLVNWSNQQKNGSLFGVFAMGALAGLICSPCTTAPLSAILLYIAQSGNTVAGGLTLYLYALGMGLPLIAVTLFGHKLLPRSGPWMQYVKEAFGFIILALPVFLLERVIGDAWGIRLWSLLAVSFLGWGFVLTIRSQNGWVRVIQLILLILMLIATRPLQDWFWGTTVTQQSQHSLNFRQINNWQELEQIMTQNSHKTVMLDFYADWCTACKEFEKYTFSDPQVQSQLGDTLLLQANVTNNSPQQKQLLEKLSVRGLPTILFFDSQGKEIPDSRVNGFMDATRFNEHLQHLPK